MKISLDITHTEAHFLANACRIKANAEESHCRNKSLKPSVRAMHGMEADRYKSIEGMLLKPFVSKT